MALLLALLVQAQDCDPAYPTDIYGNKICIPISSPDLNCKDLPALGIKAPVIVKGDDRHKLDRDKDGVGCESLGK
jgi:hypothetical protein